MFSGSGQQPQSGGQTPVVPRRFITLVAILLVVFVFGPSLVSLFTEWMWYTHDAQQPALFTKRLWTNAGLWVIGFTLSLFAVGWSAQRALQTPVVYSVASSGPQADAARRALDLLGAFGRKLAWLVAALFGLAAGRGFSAQVENWWMFQSSVPFGRTDPLFGLDLGFFVFRLPFLEAIAGLLATIAFVALFVTGLAYVSQRSLAVVAGARISEPQLIKHLSLLGGLALIFAGARLFLGRYAAGTMEGGQFTGPGYAGSQALSIMFVVSLLVAVTGLLVLAFPWFRGRVKISPLVLATPLALSVLALLIYPPLVQRVKVDPNRLTIESPFAKRGIDATRFAYGLSGEGVTVRDFVVQPEPTAEEVAGASTTLNNMRLWDPDVLRVAVNGLQSLRPYYAFYDVDIDRYEINGEPRMVMLSARNIQVSGLSPNARNWLTQKLQYTHGFGLVMAPVNEATTSGRPNFWIRNLPPVTSQGLTVEQPRLYFSDYPASSDERNGYLLLRSNVDEFDYPAQSDQKTKWTGTRGVPVGGALSKFFYSAAFSDGNLLVSPNITSETRILYRRDITDRATAVYPFLRFDSDPYVVLLEGRLVWVLDAYTTTDRIPYSAMTDGPLGRVNYIRNSVKIVVDSYSGDMTAYAMDEQEPILRMLRKAFPGLIKPIAEASEALKKHLRYGEDFFLHQAAALTQYHVTDPVTFLNNEDAWEIPTEVGRGGQAEIIKPYYVQIRLPGEKRDAFMLILPFTPRGKANMIGWMAAHCDPEEYGDLILYKFPKDGQTPGPNQMEAMFNADPTIADLNRQLNNDQSMIVPGNLLVIPIGSSILYVKPLFLQARSSGIQPIPELKKVILGLQNRVVVGDTYQEALQKLFAKTPVKPDVPTTSPDEPTRPPVEGTDAMIREAARLLDEADAALRSGDFGKYGNLQKQARAILRKLVK